MPEQRYSVIRQTCEENLTRVTQKSTTISYISAAAGQNHLSTKGMCQTSGFEEVRIND